MTTEAMLNLEAARIRATEAGVWDDTILAGTVGSTVHGLNVQDGVEDLDVMGICIESMKKAIGLSPFEQFMYRTAVIREGVKDARSKAHDVDLTIYSLRKYVRLALKGNPTILTLLFTPQESLLVNATIGRSLRAKAHWFISKEAGSAYLGYMQAQKQRLLGERGGRHGSRPELVNQFGYDSKYAAHVLRLGYQGVELMTTGKLTLPMEEGDRSAVLAVRRGQVEYNDCINTLGDVEQSLKDAISTSPLQEKPQRELAEEWMIEAYHSHWLMKS